MTSPFAKPSDYSGSSYFKPKDYMTALALIVEPKTIEKNVANTYNGSTRPRDEVVADITVFANQGALEKREPTEIIKSAKVVHGMLTSTLEKILGGATLAVVAKTETKAGSGFVFRDVDAATETQVLAYYEARETAVKDAVAAAPSFA